MGQLLRPRKLLLGLLELVSMGNKMKPLFSAQLASYVAQKSQHTNLEKHEKPMASLPVSALRPAIPRLPIPMGPAPTDHDWRPLADTKPR